MNHGDGIEQRLNLPQRYRSERVIDNPVLEPGERRVIAELEGPGCIRHLYSCFRRYDRSGSLARDVILRIYWDGETSPSVEVPAADFFGVHHNVGYYPINNVYISVKDRAGMAAYFPMPFERSCRIEVEAATTATTKPRFIYTLDWHRYLTDSFDEDLRFHASWRRENPAPAWGEDFFVMDAVGRGYLLGFSLGVRLRSDEMRWSHAGSENLYIDGEATGRQGVVPHYLRAAGGENTFDVGFGGVLHEPDSCLYAGVPYFKYQDAGPALARHLVSAYRFYQHDLVPFEKSLHFRWGSHANDMCMTAYWYQSEPHRPSVRIPEFADLAYGEWNHEVEIERGRYDLLKQIGAEGPDAVLAGPDDGAWSLHHGDQVLLDQSDSIVPGVDRHACHGFIDFSHVFSPKSRGSNVSWPNNASAVTTLVVEDETPATLHLSWANRVKIRINDDAVQELDHHRTYRYQAIDARLRSGVNTLIVNLDNPEKGWTWGAFAFSCRVVLPDGTVIVPGS